MNDLQKQFEKEWKTPSVASIETEDGSILFYDSSLFVQWLCEQLTWRSVEDKPKHGTGYVLARYKLDRPFVASYRRDIGEWLGVDNSLRDPTHWLPIPELGE